eukprot:scaffold5295_cov85-Isochrysis_galbana.AAC.3
MWPHTVTRWSACASPAGCGICVPPVAARVVLGSRRYTYLASWWPVPASANASSQPHGRASRTGQRHGQWRAGSQRG